MKKPKAIESSQIRDNDEIGEGSNVQELQNPNETRKPVKIQ